MPMPALPPAEPRSVTINLTAGTGMEVEWKDGHRSSYTFQYLRDACPCAMCNEERDKTGREPGEPVQPAPGSLPMFKAAAKPVDVERMGKYAIRFFWNDKHEHGIYSWDYFRHICPCADCKTARAASPESTTRVQ